RPPALLDRARAAYPLPRTNCRRARRAGGAAQGSPLGPGHGPPGRVVPPRDLAAAAPRLTADQFPYRAIDTKASVLNGSQPFDLFRQRQPMVRNLCERGPYGWVDCSRRGLPGHDGSSAVVRCLYIHEAPRCCDCATLQDKSALDCGAIQKNPKRCKNLTECPEGARGCGAGQRVPLAAPGESLCSAYMRAPLSEVLSLNLAVGFALATGETASALPKKHRVLSRPRSSVVPYSRRSTAWATAPSMPRTRFDSLRAWARTPPVATSRCAPA